MNQERDLFEHFYKKYHSVVFHHLMAQIGYKTEFIPLIEECVQDTFVKMIVRYDSIRDKNKISKWLCTVAHNALISELRKQKNYTDVLSRLGKAAGAAQDAYENAQERFLSLDEHRYKIQKLKDTLTPLEQDIYDNYFVQENSLAETSEKTGKSLNSTRSALHRMRKRYKKL